MEDYLKKKYVIQVWERKCSWGERTIGKNENKAKFIKVKLKIKGELLMLEHKELERLGLDEYWSLRK